jgi:hypothetical protein
MVPFVHFRWVRSRDPILEVHREILPVTIPKPAVSWLRLPGFLD